MKTCECIGVLWGYEEHKSYFMRCKPNFVPESIAGVAWSALDADPPLPRVAACSTQRGARREDCL